ncbi:DUF1003 domain-containing protein [Agromyces sp. H3Y2-19a]|jgi:uncharacterized membrane protein|uniref:DUF1003 domain-containing protein n=1 Tax=Agromyces TaxID=33877 RepID=UPI001E6423BD|nr:MULTISPECIES: DUF1003 domain-containing protein [Agromyces]MCD5348256.1 DUF1003 domain-containing protein [Agromyces sp. S2-1-8]MDF0514139.1 DUF1003 domain-containing protein [Agromyces chromiiresistens]
MDDIEGGGPARAERPLTNWHEENARGLSRGQRSADLLRNGMGSWPFVAGFLAFMGVWALLNITAAAWDPYPYILLNLFLSMLAGLQGAILLIAAKRQDAVAAALAQHDYETNLAAKTEIEELMALNRTQLALIEELRELSQERVVPASPRRRLRRSRG